ncbi:MAG TPA: hypothetical protein VJH92_06010 [Candidatus Nanoarchaeia archaeon]|nr:hypothetical protein [Candidatus Nanoarchaeia archaeon]
MTIENTKTLAKRILLGGLATLAIGCGHDVGEVSAFTNRYTGLVVQVQGEERVCTTYVDKGMDCELDLGYVVDKDGLLLTKAKKGDEEFPSFVRQFNIAKKRYDLGSL